MPFTPYHLGPSGFFALVFKKWIDPPVFLLANVVVDLEVLIIGAFTLGYPVHRYAHSLLLGAVVGLIWGLAAWPLRRLFTRIMNIARIQYRPSRWKMTLSGVLGVWLHVFIDALYHLDVRLFWPSNSRYLWLKAQRYIDKSDVKSICLLFLAAAVVPYALAVVSFYKNKKKHPHNAAPSPPRNPDTPSS